jgi:glyoxylase-like metal-dependent hydrolase (beta-lactamase superfamily II)
MEKALKSMAWTGRTLYRCSFAILIEICVAKAGAPDGPGPEQVEIAAGVYQFISPDVAGNVDGNSIAVIGDRDVLVFDTNLLPATARNVLAKLYQITDKPVRYVVNSHWHPDHSGGNEMYAHEFPDLEIIASQDTRQLMENTMSVYVKTLEYEAAQANQEIRKELKTGKGAEGRPLTVGDRRDLQSQLLMEDRFLSEYKAEKPKLPTLTFGDTLTLYHGGRELRFMRLVGHTSGDVALYLPAERILLTGDLLAYPVPYCADSHPAAWIASLEALSQLDVSTVVPGHGQAQHDQTYLRLVLESLQSIQKQVQQALHSGLTLAETQKAVNLNSIRLEFTRDDPVLNAAFEGNFTPVVRQMYDEATEGLELYQ